MSSGHAMLSFHPLRPAPLCLSLLCPCSDCRPFTSPPSSLVDPPFCLAILCPCSDCRSFTPPPQTRPSSWRYSVPALMLPGESWNPEDYDVQSVISYDGEQQTKE